jgi:nicotinamidase-related amidase
MELGELVAPGHTAILTQEVQKGVVGPDSVLPMLAEAAQSSGAIANVGRVVASGRAAGVDVIHAVARHRADMKGANTNSRLFRATARRGAGQLEDSDMVEIADGVSHEPSDLVSYRYHGVGPVAGTDVDALLRNLGATTVVVVGVSANVAIPSAVFDLVNLAYEVVVPRDAIAGYPADYTDVIVDNSIGLVATVTTTDELVATWDAVSA